ARGAGADLVAAVAHPGFASTNLQDHTTFSGARVFAQSAAQGALPTLYAATAPDVHGGDFFGPDGLMQQRGHPKRVKAARKAYDEDTARQLWQVSEQLTGVTYDFG